MDGMRTPQRLAAEVLGTAFLVFIGVGAVPATLIVNGNAPFTMADLGMISLAFGTVVVATAYAFGHVSGNHINPAVTLALALTRQFPWREVPVYLAAQLTGSLLGSLAILGVLGRRASEVGLGVAAYGQGVGAGQVAPATGASINPARTLGPMLVQQLWGGHVAWTQAPVYLAAEFLAGAAAVAAYGLTRIHAVGTVRESAETAA
ncbi:glycerol uptake facilitator protein [Nocardia sp. GAS34]|uniref:MIP/aquaporin family protein n=1 Tax=unclassified Nocardia TaxID=2637762 RepID=UPI003D1D42ED